MLLPRVHSLEFETLKKEVLKFPRMSGYYKIELVSVVELRKAGLSQEEILKHLAQQWVEHEALAPYRQKNSLPTSSPHELPTWEDSEGNSADAVELLAYGLRGGDAVGHTVDSIPNAQAQAFAGRFVSLFASPRLYWGLGFGDPEYVFENGIILTDDERAGMLLVIEND